MNRTQKILKQQSNKTKTSFSNYNIIGKMMHEPHLYSIIKPYLHKHRNRLYNITDTLGMFTFQAIHPDRSCQNIVNHATLFDSHRSISTGAYCKARGRLDGTMIKQLCVRMAQHNQEKATALSRWRSRDVYLVDGTMLIMSDTQENQEHYPQTSALPDGVGFPICRLVGIVSLSTGSLIDASISPYHGKGACEQTLLRQLLHRFKAGDVVLADAFYSTYFLIAHMMKYQIDIVFVQHGARSRSTDFTKGVQLGKNNHLVTLKKPKQKPEWMEQEAYDSAPASVSIREFKVAGKTLITTMTCEKTYPKKELENLYKKRWHIEVDLRNIKTTMGLTMLSCKTPQMVIKELWVTFLAYNLIRSFMLASALYACVLPRMLSFKHTLQLMLAYQNGQITREMLYALIAKKGWEIDLDALSQE
jgi:hypothetical protein